MRPQQKPNAAMQMGANRAAEHRADHMAALTEVRHRSTKRIVELTELVADLRVRWYPVEALGCHACIAFTGTAV